MSTSRPRATSTLLALVPALLVRGAPAQSTGEPLAKSGPLESVLDLKRTPSWSQGSTTNAPVAGGDTEALAKQLSNPVASLISVPIQANYDGDIGPAEDGSRWLVNVQPVVPITLNEDWNLISRTIVPLVSQEDIFPGAGDQSGVGDVVQSLFFSPSRPNVNNVIWGVGPVFLLPTASDDLLGAEQWGLGPTLVALQQEGPWTYGVLANHLWSVAGEDDRADVNATFVQPFISHTTPKAWTFGFNTETTYDWEGEEWSVPVNAMCSKVTRFGPQLVSLTAGLRYWADSPDSGPEGFGFRFALTFLFPKR